MAKKKPEIKPETQATSQVSNVTTIEITDPPVTMGGKKVVAIEVGPMSFSLFAASARDAEIERTRQKADADLHSKFFRRAMMRRRLRGVTENGDRIEPTQHEIGLIPRRYASSVLAALDEMNGSAGEILSPEGADGVTRPIHVKLGSPLIMGSRSDDGDGIVEFGELEFQAQTLSDIEDVISFVRPTDQVLALIRTCSTPLGPIQLMRPTDAMVEQLSMADGLMIMDKVLPSFLE